MLAFIGLGIMGKPMARNLLAAGVELILGGRDPRKLAEIGAPVADYRAIGAQCDRVILMVTDGKASKDILFSEGGLAETLRPGSVVCDMSSAAPADSVECYDRLRAIGVSYLDAPVSGGEVGAIAGELAIMAGGDREAFDAFTPYFDILGKSAVYTGPSGSGSIAKLVNQMIVHNTIACLGEAFTFAVRAGADPRVVFEAIRGGFAGSVLLDRKLPAILARDFKPGGPMRIGRKDMENAAAAAANLGVSVPMSQATLDIMRDLGLDNEDHIAIVKYFESLNNAVIQ